MSAGSDRMKAWRERRSTGRRVDLIEHDEVDTLEAVKRLGYLRDDQEDDRTAVRAAIERLFASSVAAILRGA